VIHVPEWFYQNFPIFGYHQARFSKVGMRHASWLALYESYSMTHIVWVIHLTILNDNVPHLRSVFPLWLFYFRHLDFYLSYNSTDNCILYCQSTFVSFVAQDCFYDQKQLATTDFTVARKRSKKWFNPILDNQVQIFLVPRIKSKVSHFRCVFPMVIWPEFRVRQNRDDDQE